MSFNILLLLLAVNNMGTNLLAQSDNSDRIVKTLDKNAGLLLEDPEFSSVSIGLIIHDETSIRHYGNLDRGKGESPSDQTLYEIASLTKTFTGTLFARAVVEKKVTLDDDIRDYLDREFPNLEYEEQPITFRHILTHTSGLPRMFPDIPNLFEHPDYDILPDKINTLQNNYSKEAFFNELAKVKLTEAPGNTLAYSNAAANVLGYCLENMYKKTYEELLATQIFIPLQMADSKILLSNEDEKHLAQGYNSNGLKMPFYTHKNMNAEGGIKSTVKDMMKYIKFHLTAENEVASMSHTELLNGKYGVFENGMFWQIKKSSEVGYTIFQNGGAFGTSCWLSILPDRNMGVFIITDVSSPKTHSLLEKVLTKILKEI